MSASVFDPAVLDAIRAAHAICPGALVASYGRGPDGRRDAKLNAKHDDDAGKLALAAVERSLRSTHIIENTGPLSLRITERGS